MLHMVDAGILLRMGYESVIIAHLRYDGWMIMVQLNLLHSYYKIDQYCISCLWEASNIH